MVLTMVLGYGSVHPQPRTNLLLAVLHMAIDRPLLSMILRNKFLAIRKWMMTCMVHHRPPLNTLRNLPFTVSILIWEAIRLTLSPQGTWHLQTKEEGVVDCFLLFSHMVRVCCHVLRFNFDVLCHNIFSMFQDIHVMYNYSKWNAWS